jgi:opacity protein-like surface antigen
MLVVVEAGKQMKKYIVSVFLLMTASAANTADIAAPDELPVINANESEVAEPVAERWGGAYVGVSIGQGYLTDSAPAKGNDYIYGGFAGYNAQWGHFVAGIEATADSADILFKDGSGIKSRLLYSGRVRAGWANDRMFAYGSLGAEHGVTNLPKPFSKDTALQLGAGIDFAITRNIALGVDATYAKYKNFADFTFGGNKVDVSVKKVQARLSYNFN